jgi:hypothetical protein
MRMKIQEKIYCYGEREDTERSEAKQRMMLYAHAMMCATQETIPLALQPVSKNVFSCIHPCNLWQKKSPATARDFIRIFNRKLFTLLLLLQFQTQLRYHYQNQLWLYVYRFLSYPQANEFCGGQFDNLFAR